MTPGVELDAPAPSFRVVDEGSRAFRGVMAAFLVHGLVVSTWVSRIASMKGALRLRDGTLGLCLLGAAIGAIVAAPFTGALIERFGARRVALWTAVGFSLALLPLAFTNSVAVLAVSLVYYGLMAGSSDVSMNALAVGTERLLGTPTMSRFHGMFSFGGILGAGLGALAASRGVGLTPHLLAGAALSLMAAAFAARWTVETTTEVSHAHAVGLRNIPAALVALCAIGFCIFLTEGAIADWTAVYLKQVLRANEGVVPLGYAVFSAAMAAFRFGGDAIVGKLGRARTIRAGGTLAASGLALVVLAHTPYPALAGFAMAGAGFSSIIPLVFAAGGRIPGIGEGAGVATVSSLGYLGFLVGPPAIGFISEALSLRAGMALLVILSALAVALVGVVERDKVA